MTLTADSVEYAAHTTAGTTGTMTDDSATPSTSTRTANVPGVRQPGFVEHPPRRVDQVLVGPLDLLVLVAMVAARRRADRPGVRAPAPNGWPAARPTSPRFLRHLGDDVRPDHRHRPGHADGDQRVRHGHDPRDARGDSAARCGAGGQGAGAQHAPCSSSAPPPRSPATSAATAFLDREGIGVALDDDGVLRALFGSGLYMAGLGLFAAAVGLLVRHTAAALSIVLALVFVVGNMVFLLPGTWGEWIGEAHAGQRRLPGDGGRVVQPAACSSRGSVSRCSAPRSPWCSRWPGSPSAAGTPDVGPPRVSGTGPPGQGEWMR